MEINRAHPAFQLTPAQRARLGIAAPAAQALPTGHVKQADGSITLEPEAQALVCAVQEPEQSRDDTIAAILRAAGVTIASRLIGERAGTDASPKWQHDEWAVLVGWPGGVHGTPWRAGTGLRKGGQPVAPTATELMHALISDASGSEQSFADWCSEFGFETDSIQERAQNRRTYKACRAHAAALRKMFTPAQRGALEAAVADY